MAHSPHAPSGSFREGSQEGYSPASVLPQLLILANAYLQSAHSLRATVCARATTCYSQYDLLQLSKALTDLHEEDFSGWETARWRLGSLAGTEMPLPGLWRAGVCRPGGLVGLGGGQEKHPERQQRGKGHHGPVHLG